MHHSHLIRIIMILPFSGDVLPQLLALLWPCRVLDQLLEVIPHVLNGVEIGRLCWPVRTCSFSLSKVHQFELSLDKFGSVLVIFLILEDELSASCFHFSIHMQRPRPFWRIRIKQSCYPGISVTIANATNKHAEQLWPSRCFIIQ